MYQFTEHICCCNVSVIVFKFDSGFSKENKTGTHRRALVTSDKEKKHPGVPEDLQSPIPLEDPGQGKI